MERKERREEVIGNWLENNFWREELNRNSWIWGRERDWLRFFSKWRSKKGEIREKRKSSIGRDDDFSATWGLSGLKLGRMKWNRRRRKRVDEGRLRSRPLGWVITRSSGVCKKRGGEKGKRKRKSNKERGVVWRRRGRERTDLSRLASSRLTFVTRSLSDLSSA